MDYSPYLDINGIHTVDMPNPELFYPPMADMGRGFNHRNPQMGGNYNRDMAPVSSQMASMVQENVSDGRNVGTSAAAYRSMVRQQKLERERQSRNGLAPMTAPSFNSGGDAKRSSPFPVGPNGFGSGMNAQGRSSYW